MTPQERKERFAFARKAATSGKAYTPEEDRTILENTRSRAAEMLPHRTYKAICQRHAILSKPAGDQRLWTTEEMATLGKMYSTASTLQLLAALPGRSRVQIGRKARTMGLQRVSTFRRENVRTDGHFELIDQIRERCRTDGIALKTLADQIGVPVAYFIASLSTHKTVNLVYVMKAVEFFGGKLVIDWDDR